MARFAALPKSLRIGLAAGLLAALVISLFPASSLAQLPVIRFVRDPDPAPEFKVKDLQGNDLNLASARGKVILLNFWATWCGPCKAEIPSLVELQRQYGNDLVVLGVSVDDPIEKLKPYATEMKMNYPVLVGNGRDDVQEA